MEGVLPHVERVFYDQPGRTPSESWWSRYINRLDGLTDTARAALEADSRYILHRGVLAVDATDPRSWPPSRVRTGLVLGSVQSGKTSSMLGVSALAIDHGIDIIVVLAGTRLSLWRQTYERLSEQLDCGEDTAEKVRRRLLCPTAGVALSDDSFDLRTTYRLPPASVRQKLSQRKPLLLVAMKQTNHLHALAASLRASVFPAIRDLDRPVQMLVLDDEADDGSVLDTVVESSQDPVFGNLKQVPRAIANLWDPAVAPPSNLFTTYVGYTATPQANLLQVDHNPLAPRDFLVSLRTPLDIGHMIDKSSPENIDAPRGSTYPEPAGLQSFYTGGEVFYGRGERARLCVDATGTPTDVHNAVRAFLVAGAIRLFRSGKMGPSTARRVQFDSREEVAFHVAAPTAMLYHPSATIDSHFQAAEDVLIWAGVPNRPAARGLLETGEAMLPVTLAESLDHEPQSWRIWLDNYISSAREIETEFSLITERTFPDWGVIKKLLAEEIIPGTRVAVVNSDPAADDRPHYEPTFDEMSRKWRSARDLSTIFISGNVMARGLTLEGLTTSLFERVSTSPVADTQMQMQRWFGYRGSYIELCRVFAPPGQLRLFKSYHDVDEALRVAITERMTGKAPEPAVLQGHDFSATAKIANSRNSPLSPGPQPFVRTINGGSKPDPNVEIVAGLFATTSTEVSVGGTTRGQILDTPLVLSETADLLDSLRYDDYQPSRNSNVGLQWAQVEARVSALQPLETPSLYRPPLTDASDAMVRRQCPYSIAAYLRLWEACLTRPVRGLFITGQPGTPWSMADLEQKRAQQPRFWVGIRFGSGHRVKSGPLANLPFSVIPTTKAVSGGELTTTWGANDPSAGAAGYRGDAYFDYYHRHESLPTFLSDSSWRPPGSDGLILFYVNQNPENSHPAVAVGICIPSGGPEQFAATRSVLPSLGVASP